MTLTAHWVRGWLERPDDVVLVDGDDGWALTGAAMEAATHELAGRLAAAGVGAGDRVLLSRSPSVETVLAYVAVLRLGAVVVPASTAYTARELAHIVGDVRPVLALVDDVSRIDGVRAYGGRLDDLPPGVAVRLDAAVSDDLAMVAYTSGTTGAPKGAMLSHGNLLAGAQALVRTWGWTPSDRLLHTLPLFHMHGLGAGLNGSFTAGASVVLSRFEPGLVVETAASYGATLYFGVPTMYAKLAESGCLAGLRGLRLLVSGSAPLDPVLFGRIAEEAGQAPVERYGMTETVMLTSNALDDRVPGCVGCALPGVQVRLGDGGAVEVKGPNVFRGYWERPEASAAAFTDDGFFRTGDIGTLDDQGRLRLVGRASELIITGGYNVYPREVEDVLREHPSVADVAVVGLPDATWGETVAAFVVPTEAGLFDAEVLAAHASAGLAAYKTPRTWLAVDELPRNAMGKVQRDVLRTFHLSR
ncbi:AMP-binding protein [Longivirga aurantiaca]|uniref:AMP-binding protein n=1 Tax=Longivirga aurantiaca TaxID=1837743 RepID=A0ABW1T5M8_9ACTN